MKSVSYHMHPTRPATPAAKRQANMAGRYSITPDARDTMPPAGPDAAAVAVFEHEMRAHGEHQARLRNLRRQTG